MGIGIEKTGMLTSRTSKTGRRQCINGPGSGAGSGLGALIDGPARSSVTVTSSGSSSRLLLDGRRGTRREKRRGSESVDPGDRWSTVEGRWCVPGECAAAPMLGFLRMDLGAEGLERALLVPRVDDALDPRGPGVARRRG